MTTIKVGQSNGINWALILVSVLLTVGVYIWKEYENRKTLEAYKEQQAFLQTQLTKFGVIDTQFNRLLTGRQATIEDIKISHDKVEQILFVLDSVNRKSKDTISLDSALKILNL